MLFGKDRQIKQQLKAMSLHSSGLIISVPSEPNCSHSQRGFDDRRTQKLKGTAIVKTF